MQGTGPRIAILNGVCVRHDAISESVRGMVEAFRDKIGAECRVFAYACDFPEIDARVVERVDQVILDPFFLSSDLIIYHFGVHYDLFNAILIGNGRAKQVVYYHNITPKEFLPVTSHPVIERSLRQRANVDCADAVWVVSDFNRRDLVEFGIAAEGADVIPLYSRSRHVFHGGKPADRIEILYVGRFVKAKGVLDLLAAFAEARPKVGEPLFLKLVGNVAFSDSDYIAQIEAAIAELGLEESVAFLGQVDDATLWSCYDAAHIFATASYHEGFCVPLVEAMHAGCIPIGYAAGNVESLIAEHGVLVPAGDVHALAAAIVEVAETIERSRSDPAGTPWRGDGETFEAFRARLHLHAGTFAFEPFADRVSELASALLAGPEPEPEPEPESSDSIFSE